MPSKIVRFLLSIILLLISVASFSQEQPIPDWVKGIGGTGESKLAGIAVDKDDNVYVAGNFQGALTVDQSGISTPVVLTSNGHYDIYVAKYTPDGKLLWAKSIGGSNLDQVNNLAVDKDGNVIIGASFSSNSIDCDPGAGVFTVTSNGGEDALVVKLDTDGNFVWAKSVGGSNTDRGHVITADKDANIIFVGSFSSSNITVAGNTLSNKGNFDGFVVKYDRNGNVVWSTGFGSAAVDEIKSVKTDSEGAIAIMGYYGANINLNPRGTAQNYTANRETYFLAKYSDNGILNWANTYMGTATMASISIGPTNDIFMTGVYSGQLVISTANQTSTLDQQNSAKHLFIGKYKSNGMGEWHESASSTANNPYSYYITVDKENNAYIGGFFDQTLTFRINGTSPRVLNYHGGRDTFFAKYNTDGDCQWAFNFGSSCTGNFGHKIDVDSKKNVLLGGAFCRTVDFNPGNCDLSLTAKHGTSDGYIAKFNQIKLTGEPLITKFELQEQSTPAIIDVANKKITVTVRAGTDITKLKPKIDTDIGVLNPLSDVETNFTTPKTYKITSNCIDYFWEVTVVIANVITIPACPGDLVTFNGEPNVSGSFQWQVLLNNGWTIAPGNSTQANYQNEFRNTTGAPLGIQIRRQRTNNGVTTYDSHVLLALSTAIQNNSINSTQLNFCSKGSTTLTGSIASSGTTTIAYSWQKSLDNNTWTDIPNSNSKDFTTPELTETTYFRRLATANTCIVYSNAIKIEILTPPTITVAGNTSGCSSVSLTATGGISYQWSGGQTPNQASNTFTSSGTYSVTVTGANGCTATISKTVTIGAGQTTINGNDVGCNSVTLTATGGVTYQWNGGNTPNQASNTFTQSGTYSVTITDANGCTSVLQKIVTINPNNTPTLSITSSTNNICRGGTIRFTLNYTNAGANPTFKWFKNGVQVESTENYIANGLQNNDEIYCEIIGSIPCSVPFISNKVKVTVNDLPTVGFGHNLVIENDGPKILSPDVSENVVSYKWFPTTGLDNPNIKNPKANPESTTEYTLTVTGPGGCSAEASVKVVVLKEIFIPNVFSPNGDGKNDQWLIRNIADYVGTKVQIFNRYGQQVFQSDNFITPWDGIFSGKPLPLGSYYYILDLANKSKTRYTGSVTILR